MCASFPTIIETVLYTMFTLTKKFPVQFNHNNKRCRKDGWSVLLFQYYYRYDV